MIKKTAPVDTDTVPLIEIVRNQHTVQTWTLKNTRDKENNSLNTFTTYRATNW